MMIGTNKYDWLWLISSIIFILTSWMIWLDYPPLIKLEEKTSVLFQDLFGYPQMTYSDGLINSLLTFLATYGSAPFLSTTTVVVSLVLFLKGDILLAVWFLTVVSTGGLFGILLKGTFQRNRPSNHLASETGFSFPSGHAIASTLFFLSIILVFLPMIALDSVRYILAIFFSLSWFGILFSRLYFHSHHLGDLIVGVFYGVFWVKSAIYMYQLLIDLSSKYT